MYTLTPNNRPSFAVVREAGSANKIALGAVGMSYSVIRTYGNWSFTPDMIVLSKDQRAEVGFHMDISSSLTAPVDVSGWSIANNGYEGTFSYDNGGIHLDLTAIVPQPATIAALMGAAALAGVALRHPQKTRHS